MGMSKNFKIKTWMAICWQQHHEYNKGLCSSNTKLPITDEDPIPKGEKEWLRLKWENGMKTLRKTVIIQAAKWMNLWQTFKKRNGYLIRRKKNICAT